MTDLSIRSSLPEKMDQADESKDETLKSLSEIETINKWLGGYNVIINAFEKLEWPNRTVTIVDLGSGGGDTLRVIAKWAKKNNKSVKLIGIDRNPVMTEYATSRSQAFGNLIYMTMDVFDPKLLDIKADITMNSLFCHHFNNDELTRLMGNMYKIASHSVIINDIDRHWLAYYSIKWITALFSKTYMVKYDAPLSVARSLTKREWQLIMQQAGIKTYSLQWMWAWRWQIIIRKPEVHA